MANWPTDYDELTAPADGDKILVGDTSETVVGKKVKWWTNTGLKAFLKTYFDTLYPTQDSWNVATGTWSYSSADAPTFISSVNADMTAIIYPGQRLSLTQTTEKFFIVTAVGAYSGGATLITMYGGTDYTLTANPITSPKWSNVKVPSRFPMSPSKWTVEVAASADYSQASPTASTWYNMGTTNSQISVPIGIWNVDYSVVAVAAKAATTSLNVYATLSTANNSASDAQFTSFTFIIGASASLQVGGVVGKIKTLSIASKTVYYLNGMSASSADNIYFLNSLAPMRLRAICAYL